MFIYVMEAKYAGLCFYKVGITSNPNERLKTVQTSCIFPLEMIFEERVEHAREVEKEAHLVMKNRNTSGEWFAVEKNDVVQLIKDLISSTPSNFDFQREVRVSYFNNVYCPFNIQEMKLNRITLQRDKARARIKRLEEKVADLKNKKT